MWVLGQPDVHNKFQANQGNTVKDLVQKYAKFWRRWLAKIGDGKKQSHACYSYWLTTGWELWWETNWELSCPHHSCGWASFTTWASSTLKEATEVQEPSSSGRRQVDGTCRYRSAGVLPEGCCKITWPTNLTQGTVLSTVTEAELISSQTRHSKS